MSRTVTITLEMVDVLQILDALQSRAEAWEKTAALLKGKSNAESKSKDNPELTVEDVLDDNFFIPEECSNAHEAEEIAAHFRDIIKTLEKQAYASEESVK